jgi:hypothetical protein
LVFVIPSIIPRRAVGPVEIERRRIALEELLANNERIVQTVAASATNRDRHPRSRRPSHGATMTAVLQHGEQVRSPIGARVPWALIAGGLIFFVGGAMHPEEDPRT